MLSSKLMAIHSALTAIEGLKAYHYKAPSSETLPYCVWYEDGEYSSLETDNHKAEQAIGGYVDYFTKTEFDGMVDAIQNALNGVDNCSWSYDATIYGDPSSDSNNAIHHVFRWRVL